MSIRSIYRTTTAMALVVLAAAILASPASADSGFVTDDYPAEVAADGPQGKITIAGSAIFCDFPPISAIQKGPEKTLATYPGANGTCSVGGQEKTLDMNGCQIVFDPGAEAGEGSFEGDVSIGPEECGPITLDMSFFQCAELEFYPDELGAQQTDLVNTGEGSEAEVEIDTIFEIGWEFTNGCEVSGSTFVEATWQSLATTEFGQIGLRVASEPFPEPNTTLCEVEESPCPVQFRYQEGETVSGASADATFDVEVASTLFEVSCSESTLSGELGSDAGNPLPIDIDEWSLSGCTHSPAKWNCTATGENLDFAGSILATEAFDGVLSIADGGSGEPGWRVKCPVLGLDCILGFESDVSIEGGNYPNAKLVANEIPLTKTPATESAGCPENEPSFSASYSTGLFVATG